MALRKRPNKEQRRRKSGIGLRTLDVFRPSALRDNRIIVAPLGRVINVEANEGPRLTERRRRKTR